MGRRGFSFVEILMVGVVLSLIIGAILTMASTSEQMWVRTDNQTEAMNITQRALDRLSQDLQSAALASLAICQADSISFSQSGTGIPIAYNRTAANTLERTFNNGQPQVVAAGVTAFLPRCQGELVNLSFTSNVTSTRGTFQQTLQAQVRIHNP